MFNPDAYITALTSLLQEAFGPRLAYVGLQGSYLRGEAAEDSDIDIMAVVRDLSPSDLKSYREAIASLEGYEKSCGFICSTDDLLHWNPLEVCHLLHTTRDHFGKLADLTPPCTAEDVRAFVKLSLGNLYHEICHRYVHRPLARNVEALPATYKAVFFILQNLHYLESGVFIATKAEMLSALTGQDRLVMETALSLAKGKPFDFDEAFALLFRWCQDALKRSSDLG